MKYPSNRKDAFKTGNKYYKTDKPCSYGHNSKRYTSSKGCYECSLKQGDKSNEAKKKRLENNELCLFNTCCNNLPRVGSKTTSVSRTKNTVERTELRFYNSTERNRISCSRGYRYHFQSYLLIIVL